MKIIPGPADVTRVGRGADRVYIVRGVMRLDKNGEWEPAIKPSKAMRIRPGMGWHRSQGFVLEVADEVHSRHDSLLEARYAASRIEWPEATP